MALPCAPFFSSPPPSLPSLSRCSTCELTLLLNVCAPGYPCFPSCLLSLSLLLLRSLPFLTPSQYSTPIAWKFASKQAKTAPTPFRSLDGATAPPPYNYSFFRYEGKI